MEATKDSGAIIVQVYECITDTCNFIQNQHELIRFDKNGKKVWHTKNISNKAHHQDLIKLLLTSDEGVIVIETDYSKEPTTNLSLESLELKKFNNKGEFEWSRTHYWPKDHRNYVVGGLTINPNTFAVTGWRLFANLAGSNPPIEQDATWVMLLDSMGCPKNTPNCSEINYLSTNDIKVPLDRGTEELTVYPNPTTNYLNVQCNIPNPRALKYQILSMNGYLIQSGAFEVRENTSELDVSNLPTGMYLIKVFDGNWQSMPVKWVKM